MSDFNIVVKGLVYTAILMYTLCSRQVTCDGIKKAVNRNITNLYVLYYPFIVHLKINIFKTVWVRLCCFEVLIWDELCTDRPVCFSSGPNPATCWMVGWADTQLLPRYMMLGHGKYRTVKNPSISRCLLAHSSPLDLCNDVPIVSFTSLRVSA